MKKIKILTVALLAIGLASAGIGCGSTSSGSSGNQVSSGLNALPPATLTTANVGSAASQAINAANETPSANTSSFATPGGALGALSYVVSHSNNIIIKPQSMRGPVLQALSSLKTAGYNITCPYGGTMNETGTSSSVTIVFSACGISNTETLNGSMTISGVSSSSDSISANISYSNFSINENQSGGSLSTTVNGSLTIAGSGITVGSTNITYTEKGSITISGSATNWIFTDFACSEALTGTFNGWISIDDSFSGSASQVSVSGNVGQEEDGSGTTSGGGSFAYKIGHYGVYSFTMAITGDPQSPTSFSINGTGTFGANITGTVSGTSSCSALTPTSTSYYGKYSVTLNNITFDSSCASAPSAGTLTITANHIFLLDFNGAACGCASVSEDGKVINANYCTLY